MAKANIRLKGITTKINIRRVKLIAERVFPSLRESFICTGYKTKANMMAQRMGLKKGKSIKKAKAVKKTVKDRRK